jgi:hypothetical protein
MWLLLSLSIPIESPTASKLTGTLESIVWLYHEEAAEHDEAQVAYFRSATKDWEDKL